MLSVPLRNTGFFRRLNALAGTLPVVVVLFVVQGCVIEPSNSWKTQSQPEAVDTPPASDTSTKIQTEARNYDASTPTRRFVLAHQPGAMPDIGIDTTQQDAEQRLAHLPPRFGLGRTATVDEIAAWDIDIMPDGTGLPDGQGTVAAGAVLYKQQCESCHGIDADGGRYEALAGREPREGFPFGEDPSLRFTVGNYWPYATTLFDYTRRAMPQAIPGSLSADQVYSLVAYLLFLNELVPEGATLDAQSLAAIEMPARDRFVVDDRRGGTELR